MERMKVEPWKCRPFVQTENIKRQSLNIDYMAKICGIATKAGTVKAFMIPNFTYMVQHGWDCYCISDGSIDENELGGVKQIPMTIHWGFVGPIVFLKTLIRFYRIFKRERFDVIQYATFNSAFPAAIAGWLAGVPVRINLQWGMSYISATGFTHLLKRTVEKITCWCSTSVQPDSIGNLKLSIQDGLYPEDKGYVIYNGSATGVDLQKYDITKRDGWRKELFEQYGLDSYKRVFGYVGRVTKDKGIDELLESFMKLDSDDAFLWIIGPLGGGATINQDLYHKAQAQPNIVFTGPVPNAAKYYAAMDFMMLPSYHEGFGMTVVESAGMGTPSIITNINGPTELIKDKINGLICEVKSVDSLFEVLCKALNMTTEEYTTMCDNAYRIAKTDFDGDTFKVKFYENREMLLEKALVK